MAVMLRRAIRLAVLAAAMLSLLGIAVAAASHVWPAALRVWRLDIDQSSNGAYTTRIVGVSHSWMWTTRFPEPALSGPFRQVDWTLGLMRTPGDMPALAPWWSLWTWSLALLAVAAGLRWHLARGAAAPVAVNRQAKHLRRLHAAIGGGVVLMMITVTFGVRSLWRFERLDLAVPLFRGPEAIQLNSSGGSLMVAWTRAGPHRTLNGGGFAFVRWIDRPFPGPLYNASELKGDFARPLGFTLGWDGGSALPRNVLIVPYWFPVLGLAGLCAGGFRWSRRLRARDVGEHCGRCGYDVRGIADRCPECGTPIARGAAPSAA